MNISLDLLTLLSLKHFIVDFPLQTPYQWMNKGTYGHFGGIIHSAFHGLATALCIWWYAPLACIWLGLIDAVLHYHIDWAKMNINAKYQWKADTHPQFWTLLGLDQLLHMLTYIMIVGLITEG